MSSLSDLLKIAAPVRAFALKNYSVTAHPDEVLQIPSRDEGRFIRIHAYNTLNRATPFPVLVNFHGSGFTAPIDSHQNINFQLPSMTLKMQSTGSIHNLRNSTLPGSRSPASAQVASSHWFLGNTEKIAPDTSIDPAPVGLLDAFIQCYYANPEDVKSAFASLAVMPAEKFSGRIFLVTAAYDRLCLEGKPLGDRLRNETTKHVEMHRYEGCEYAFDEAYTKGSVQERAKDDFYERAATFLTE
ncbi:hypothetical protein BDW74DRAFT_168583 [Aspergillus multicolor]|uniref:uncharacterized protein n=1 Tax=Aspergillus multicolor TaxID=41759 RepID=UPI003CCD18C4